MIYVSVHSHSTTLVSKIALFIFFLFRVPIRTGTKSHISTTLRTCGEFNTGSPTGYRCVAGGRLSRRRDADRRILTINIRYKILV